MKLGRFTSVNAGSAEGLDQLVQRDRAWGASAENVSRLLEFASVDVVDPRSHNLVLGSMTYRTGRAVLTPLRLLGVGRRLSLRRRRRESRPAAARKPVHLPDIDVTRMDLTEALDASIPLPTGEYFLFVQPGYSLLDDWYTRVAPNCNEAALVYFAALSRPQKPFAVSPAWSPTLVAAGWNPLESAFAVHRDLLIALREQQDNNASDFTQMARRIAQTAAALRSAVHHVPSEVSYSSNPKRGGVSREAIGLAAQPEQVLALTTPQRNENVSVIVPTAFSSDASGHIVLEQCLASIFPSLRDGDEVILSLGASDRDHPSISRLAQLAPCELRAISDDDDFNFSRRVNLGVLSATNDFVLIVNDDVVINSDHPLDTLVAYATPSDVAGVGVFLTLPSGEIQHAGHIYEGAAAHHILEGHRPEDYRGTAVLSDREVSGVTAACLMTRTDVWHELGGMSHNFPLNFNDVDFCLKAGLAGYRIIQANTVRGEHRVHSTREPVVTQREYTRLLRRWRFALQFDTFTLHNPE